jgi:BNR repeat-like domain
MRRISILVAGLVTLSLVVGGVADARKRSRPLRVQRSGIVKPVTTQVRPAVLARQATRRLRAPAASAAFTTLPISVGANQNVVVGDVTNSFEHPNGPACHVGDETPQNETTISVDPTNPNNLVGGANDYRYFLPSEGRYDGSGAAYVSHDGGASWTNTFIPGVSEAAGGTYQGLGDPAFAWDPSGNAVYYANIAFNRVANPATGHSAFASSIVVSKSVNDGDTWTTDFVIESDDPNVFHDKEWIGVAPNGDVYVTWALFRFQPKGKTGLGGYEASPIVFSKSTDGGQNWSAPREITGPFAQFSTPAIAPDGTVYVSYEEWNNPVGRNGGRAMVARSTKGGSTWTQHLVARVNDLPSPLHHGAFRAASYPVMDVDDQGNLHMVWSNWQGGSGDIVYTRSTNRAASWSRPVTINQEAVKSDQFFQWIDASGRYLHVGFVDRQYTDDALLDHSYLVSANRGTTWSQTVRVTAASSSSDASLFGANCTGEFIGDYTGIAATGNTANVLWMDGRPGTQAGGDGTDQDAFYAKVTVGV